MAIYDLYAASRDNRLRFALGRTGSRMLVVIGLNPSTATSERADVTLAKVDQTSRRHGFDGFVLLNLYPRRATAVDSLPIAADRAVFAENIDRVAAIVRVQEPPVVWAAWGASILERAYLASAAGAVVAGLRMHRPSWRHFGPLTRGGHPRHPSRLHYEWEFSPFDADAYVLRLSGGHRHLSDGPSRTVTSKLRTA